MDRKFTLLKHADIITSDIDLYADAWAYYIPSDLSFLFACADQSPDDRLISELLTKICS